MRTKTQRCPAPRNIQKWRDAGTHPGVSGLLCLEHMLPQICLAWAPGQTGTAGIASVGLENREWGQQKKNGRRTVDVCGHSFSFTFSGLLPSLKSEPLLGPAAHIWRQPRGSSLQSALSSQKCVLLIYPLALALWPYVCLGNLLAMGKSESQAGGGGCSETDTGDLGENQVPNPFGKGISVLIIIYWELSSIILCAQCLAH